MPAWDGDIPAARQLQDGLLTIAAPWLMRLPAMHGVLEALGCRSLPI